jgi:hypothetical protein
VAYGASVGAVPSARGTLEWLAGSGAFASVQLDALDAPKADLTATPIGTYCNTAAIPLFTILSLGVMPTVYTDTDREGPSFRANNEAGARHDSAVVRYRQDGRVGHHAPPSPRAAPAQLARVGGLRPHEAPSTY